MQVGLHGAYLLPELWKTERNGKEERFVYFVKSGVGMI